MPMSVVDLHAEQMTRLMAREALHAATVAAFGSGNMSRSDMRSVRREWLREARYDSGKRVAGSREELEVVMGGMGIRVRSASGERG